MAIGLSDVRALFTKTLIDVYQERVYPTQFLTSLFKTDVLPTKTVAIEVERMGEKVSVDVVRGTEGTRNQFARSSEKIFEPPLYREYFDMTELDLYDRVLGSMGNAQTPLWNQLMLDSAERLDRLTDKIRRAKELQCSQVLVDGVVRLVNGVSIDYRRKAASIVNLNVSPPQGYPTGFWTTGATDVFGQIQAACNFLRQVGRTSDGTFNMILGDAALAALLSNTTFTTRQNLFNMALDQVIGPQRGAEGMNYHGTLSAGVYKVQIWTYAQFYDLDNGNGTFTSTRYIPTDRAILLPLNPRFKMAHCAVPRLIGQPGQLPVQSEYVIQEFLDDRMAKHELDVQSAPLAIPVAVDQIVTLKVVA